MLDRPFLDKFKYKLTYCSGSNEYIDSIFAEISNILSCKLRKYENIDKNPFNYGIEDILSLDLTTSGIEKFKTKCENIIKILEPRIRDFRIEDIDINKNEQKLTLYVSCVVKKTKEIVSRTVVLLT
ncbi:MAG: hypothetical protein LBI26_02230 [Holosporales bacterium]|jgi:predicted component of type VI protein secretion system|nr:hypothetical protein [Holosporales bacterium]